MFARRTSYVLPHRPDTAQKFLHSVDFYNEFIRELRKTSVCLNGWLYVASFVLSTRNPFIHAVCCNLTAPGIRKCLKSSVTHQKYCLMPN